MSPKMAVHTETNVPEEALMTLPSSTELDDAEIAERAYSYWEARGFENGSPEEDWLRAVDELRAERARQE